MKNSVVVFVILILTISGCTGNGETSIEGGSEVTLKEAEIVLKNIQFSPREVTIERGGTVTWINDESVTHTVTFDDGSLDITLKKGEKTQLNFNDPGTYNYVCTIHPGMKGVVIVK